MTDAKLLRLFGKHVMELREKMGLTQEEAARQRKRIT